MTGTVLAIGLPILGVLLLVDGISIMLALFATIISLIRDYFF